MTVVDIGLKTCTTCGETKPLTAFHPHSGPRKPRDGRRSYCRECDNRRRADAQPRAAQDVAWPIAGFDLRREEWMVDAACRGMGNALFYPDRGNTAPQLREICAGCPVRAECLAYGDEVSPKHGFWGGLSVEARKQRRLQGKAS